jgi:hypothetical protein
VSLETTITLAANAAIALSFVAALIFGIVQAHAAARDRKERFTLEALRTFQTREFAEIIHYLRLIKTPQSRDEFWALPERDQILMIQSAQMMESLGMMVYEKYIDLDLVDKTLGSYVSTMWEKYKPMFTDMRESLPDPYLGEYFQWLAERISALMQGTYRAPFYANTKRKGRRGR